MNYEPKPFNPETDITDPEEQAAYVRAVSMRNEIMDATEKAIEPIRKMTEMVKNVNAVLERLKLLDKEDQP